LDSLTPKTCP